jgi:hypothetical protein
VKKGGGTHYGEAVKNKGLPAVIKTTKNKKESTSNFD